MREFTKKSLVHRFMEMCEEVPLKDIRVKDFIEYAGISRQTFYNYFRDKSDIMNCVFELAAEKVAGSMSATMEDLYRGTEEMARVCLASRKFYVQLARYETQNDFLHSFEGWVEKAYRSALERSMGTEHLDGQLKQMIHIYSTGACTAFVEWMRGGMKEPPEELAAVIVSCTPVEMAAGLKQSS